jgi:hypothetical protein
MLSLFKERPGTEGVVRHSAVGPCWARSRENVQRESNGLGVPEIPERDISKSVHF